LVYEDTVSFQSIFSKYFLAENFLRAGSRTGPRSGSYFLEHISIRIRSKIVRIRNTTVQGNEYKRVHG
jgi:hypothetical protein